MDRRALAVEERLQQTLATIEKHQAVLGTAVVETTLAVLRDKLASLDNHTPGHLPARSPQRKQVTILFANVVSGSQNTRDSITDTNTLNLMNLLWRRLDQAIQEQGGTIDKHIGDAVMGLFGVPVAREDDPERAVRAALTMRAALSDFVDEMRVLERSGAIPPTKNFSLDDLQLRVGINTGPVLLGEVGKADEYTVIGDAVNVASRLERATPPGAILISHDTYLLVRGIFNVESLGPVAVKGKSDPIQVYLALGLKPRQFYRMGRGVEGLETRMVGRDSELQQLQKSLQTTIQTGKGQIITITGEAGVGKSRLIYEFNRWIESLNAPLTVLKARTDERVTQLPYLLFRDLFASYLGILDNDRASVVEEKLVQGISNLWSEQSPTVQNQALVIGQLIGLDLSGEFGVRAETVQLRERAYGYVEEFFRRLTAESQSTLIFLEDVHWADSQSVELIEQLGMLCQHIPLVMVCLARPLLMEKRPFWGNSPEAIPQTTIRLTSLSQDHSHQLVLDILRKLPQIPTDLSDLIVSRSEGNPFYVEELIKVLIEDGVIVTGQEEWQLQRNQLTKVRVPLTLAGVLQARLDRLSVMERLTLQRAAVVGRIFWDKAIIHMNQMSDESLGATETKIALQALEKREIIFHRQASIFAGTQAYVFKHAILHEVTYESVLLRARPAYHKQVAHWLAEQSGERVAEHAALIAEHYELAGESVQAAELYEAAGSRAQDAFALPLAIDYYGKALMLLSNELHHAAWQIRLQERLGELLKLQARLVEAAQTYMTMRYTAEIDGDLIAQAHAWNGQASIHREQADNNGLLEKASRAEQVAWLVNAEEELATALLYKSEAYWRSGDFKLALVTAEKAREISERLNDTDQIAKSLSLLCAVCIGFKNSKGVHHYLAKLEKKAQETAENSAKTAYQHALGDVYFQLKQYDKAAHHLTSALKVYRQTNNQSQASCTLHLLGEAARLHNNAKTAVSYYRQALAAAETIGDQYSRHLYRTHLAAAWIELGQHKTAELELRQVMQWAGDVSKVVNWRGLPELRQIAAKLRRSPNPAK